MFQNIPLSTNIAILSKIPPLFSDWYGFLFCPMMYVSFEVSSDIYGEALVRALAEVLLADSLLLSVASNCLSIIGLCIPCVSKNTCNLLINH